MGALVFSPHETNLFKVATTFVVVGLNESIVGRKLSTALLGASFNFSRCHFSFIIGKIFKKRLFFFKNFTT
jgi:hypothetical protein